MYNKVILMGRITHDLELKQTPNGVSVCAFQIAVDRCFQTKGKERKSDFFRVETWRQTAEFVTKYFSKGRMILVEGELHNDDYTDKNGNNWTAAQMYHMAESANIDGKPRCRSCSTKAGTRKEKING